MRQDEKLLPVVDGQAPLVVGNWGRVRHRPVRREDAAPQEARALRVNLELQIAVEKTGADARLERLHQAIGRDDVDDAHELSPWHEPQRHGHDEAEQSVATDDEPEEFRALAARAADEPAVGVDQRETFDVANEWPHRQAAPVNVGGHCAADAQPVCARLLLRDRPLHRRAALRGREIREQLGPLRSRFDLDRPAFAIERDDVVESPRVE